MERYPRDRVLGEEASRDAAGPRTWVIDPLDGTTEFLRRIPVWMVAIALVVAGRPVVAVAYNPSTRECYWATADGVAYRDERPLRVSTRDGIAEPALICGTGANRDPGELSGTVVRVTFRPELRVTELGGLPVVFAGCKVAEGALDGFLYEFTGAHDLAAVSLIVERAGELVTSRQGERQPLDQPVDGGVGSNGVIHAPLVRAWSDRFESPDRRGRPHAPGHLLPVGAVTALVASACRGGSFVGQAGVRAQSDQEFEEEEESLMADPERVTRSHVRALIEAGRLTAGDLLSPSAIGSELDLPEQTVQNALYPLQLEHLVSAPSSGTRRILPEATVGHGADRVVDVIRGAIEANLFAPGVLLPRRQFLTGDHDVTLAEVNAAVATLRGEGLVVDTTDGPAATRGTGTWMERTPFGAWHWHGVVPGGRLRVRDLLVTERGGMIFVTLSNTRGTPPPFWVPVDGDVRGVRQSEFGAVTRAIVLWKPSRRQREGVRLDLEPTGVVRVDSQLRVYAGERVPGGHFVRWSDGISDLHLIVQGLVSVAQPDIRIWPAGPDGFPLAESGTSVVAELGFDDATMLNAIATDIVAVRAFTIETVLNQLGRHTLARRLAQ